jgi:long-chain acyl-CoA synthetase
MTVISFPENPLTTTVGTANLTDLIYRNATRNPDAASFRRDIDGQWADVTARDFLGEVTSVARGLIASGVAPGDRVALLSRTRYEWTLFDFASWCAGAVTVPIYETSSPEQVKWILADSGAVACVTESAKHTATVDALRADLPELRHVWQIDGVGSGAPVADGVVASPGAVGTLSLLGHTVPGTEIAARRAELTNESVATLIYTSGTTGRPKGCVLTHGNFLAEVRGVSQVLHPMLSGGGTSTLLFLPLAHVFARVIQLVCVAEGVTMGHSPDVRNLLDDLAAFSPTFILAVPRVFEKVYNSASQKAEKAGRGKVFAKATDTAIAYAKAVEAGKVTLRLRTKHTLFDKLVYAKLRAALGGRATYAVSGGSPLSARLGYFFRGIGVTIVEGYGLTETTAAAAVNPPQAVKVGTVGQVVPGTQVRIAADGEVLLRGPVVFSGYWNNPVATAEAVEADGWFHTGDIGQVDAEGYLSITGRKKELIVTAGGKNVAPAVIEDRIGVHPLVGQAMVVGDNQPFIAALITLDPEYLPLWLERHGKPADTAAEDLIADADLLADIDAAIAEGNKAVSKAESVRKYQVLATTWTEEGGQLTPSIKLKRAVVAREHAADIAALYA